MIKFLMADYQYVENGIFENMTNRLKIENLYSLLLELKVGDKIEVSKEFIEMLVELKYYIDKELDK